jgi:hypothetical protein
MLCGGRWCFTTIEGTIRVGKEGDINIPESQFLFTPCQESDQKGLITHTSLFLFFSVLISLTLQFGRWLGRPGGGGREARERAAAPCRDPAVICLDEVSALHIGTSLFISSACLRLACLLSGVHPSLFLFPPAKRFFDFLRNQMYT